MSSTNSSIVSTSTPTSSSRPWPQKPTVREVHLAVAGACRPAPGTSQNRCVGDGMVLWWRGFGGDGSRWRGRDGDSGHRRSMEGGTVVARGGWNGCRGCGAIGDRGVLAG
ncbi:hypothetical protein RJT34_25450 [Clitoria ternatea]|uniref:Uncharacterized protein n=1 Tax=Clitoria ternatea TaxID=43366 RepID=A0AAN9FSM8_CLITE